MSPEELKQLLSTPVALFVLMLVGSFASVLKQLVDAKKNDSTVTVMSYLAHWPETVTTLIANVFAFIGLLMTDTLNYASAIGIGYMANSGSDLIRAGGRSAAVAAVTKSHWLAGVLAAVIGALMLSGCAATPASVLKVACAPSKNYLIERCAKSVAETYLVYQSQAAALVKDPATPPEVVKQIKLADAQSSPAVLALVGATKVYVGAKEDLAKGVTDADKLAIANANLERWVADAAAKINYLIAALGG